MEFHFSLSLSGNGKRAGLRKKSEKDRFSQMWADEPLSPPRNRHDDAEDACSPTADGAFDGAASSLPPERRRQQAKLLRKLRARTPHGIAPATLQGLDIKHELLSA